MIVELQIPEDLQAFMADLVALLDAGDDAERFQSAAGHGRRDPASGRFAITYEAPGRAYTIEVDLDEAELRAIAIGTQTIVRGDRTDLDTPRASKGLQGLPLLLWGDGPRDRCLITGYADLERLLRALWTRPTGSFRLWSRRDDLMLGALRDGLCALQFLRSDGRYGTTAGDPERSQTIEVTDLDGTTRALRGSDFVPLTEALPLILRFAADGDVPDDDAWSPMLTGQFFELSLQVGAGPSREAPSEPALTSLARHFGAHKTPPAWARAFVRICRDQALIELASDADQDALAAVVAGHVESLATSAHTPKQIAESLAEALTETPGVEEVFATTNEMSDALHRALSESAPPPR